MLDCLLEYVLVSNVYMFFSKWVYTAKSINTIINTQYK